MTGGLKGRLLPQKGIVFVVAGEEERFPGAPPDWITVREYVLMRLESAYASWDDYKNHETFDDFMVREFPL